MKKVLSFYTYIDGLNDKPFPNDSQQVVAFDFRSDYKRMGGAPTISCTIMYPTCLDKIWTDNVYAYLNGERFFIKQTPSSSFDNTDSRYKHEVELVSERIMLDNVYFYDVVQSDVTNDKPVSNSSNVIFFGDIHEFAKRLNYSLQYSNVGYSVVVDDGISSEGKMMSFQNQFFSNVLQEIYNTYGVPYYFVGKVIHIGYTNNAITHTFKYGVDESLLSIQKQNANYKVVNRVTGIGSADNIPYYYPNDYESKEEVEANGGTWINPQPNLMPSIYRETLGNERFYKAFNKAYQIPGSDEYYEFENPYIEGKPKEHIVNFDYIKPTIKGITNSEGLRIDMFKEFAYDANDNDEVDEEGNCLHPYFFAKLRKFDGEHGFNLFDHAIDEQEMVISMTSGSCGACEFAIGVDENTQKNLVQIDEYGNLLRDSNGNVRCGRKGMQKETPQDVQNDTENNEVWIALKKDIQTFGVVMPNASKNYRPSTNDTFVILHIDLPKAYILAAENNLKEQLIKYMAMNNSEKFTFSISFSRIFFAENPQILAQLNENARIQIEYDNTTYELYVSSYSYSMSKDSPLPEIRIELLDTLTISQNALQTAISDIKTEIISSIGGSGSIDILKLGLRYFLRKDKDDNTSHNLGVGRSLSVGANIKVGGDIVSKEFGEDTKNSGYAIRKNEDDEYEAEADNIVARILSKTYDLLVKNHATFVGDLTSEEFISGFVGGKGWSIRTKEILNAAGITEKKSVAEFDDLIVRGSMRVYEFIISQLLGENDNRIFTGMMEVDHYDALEGKIYLKTNGGRLYNPFRVDDVIIVQQYGGMPSEENNYYVTKQYEFIVTEAGVGEMGENRLDWVRFRNFTTSMEGGNEKLIAEYDTLVRLDNISDANRKGIIQLMSVGEDTPYMDFIYGAKTDPENSLKGRLGNLGGIYNPLFGWLKEFGAYLTNLYAVGEFVIAHTGENVSDSIEIAKGQFRTNYRQTTYDMSEEDNFFTNASLTNNCEHWTLGADTTEYFIVDDLPQFFNFDLYATEDTYAGIAEWKGRDMLRLSSSTARQANSLIKKAGTHKVYTNTVENEDGTYTDVYEDVPDTLYLSVRLYVASSGKVDFGFVNTNGAFINNKFRYSEDLIAREDGYEIKLSGTWDGKGDFCIASTGDVYVDLLSLTDKPLDNFKITTSTKIEQDARRIALLGKKINGVEGSVTNLGVELDAAEERITVYVNKEVKDVEASVSALDVTVKGISTTVASIQGTANNAKSLANAAQSAADDAAAKALAAQKTADSAGSKATANATAISQQANSISLLAGAFTLQGGKYVLTSAAGAVITSEVAKLYATKTTVDSLSGRVSTAESSISTMSGQIALKASQSSVDSLGKRVTTAESSITVNATNIESKVSKNGVISSINQSSESVTINASKINLSGQVTMSMLNSSLKTTINGKASASSLTSLQNSLGSLAYQNSVGKAMLDSTIISGGYIKTSLIDVDSLVAKKVVTNGDTHGVTTTMADGEISMKTSSSVNLLRIYSNGSSSHIGLKDTSSNTILLNPVSSSFSFSNGKYLSINATNGIEFDGGMGIKRFAISSIMTSLSADGDLCIIGGNYSMPNASYLKGRVMWVYATREVTLTGSFMNSNGSSASSISCKGMNFFISNGSNWYRGYCQ